MRTPDEILSTEPPDHDDDRPYPREYLSEDDLNELVSDVAGYLNKRGVSGKVAAFQEKRRRFNFDHTHAGRAYNQDHAEAIEDDAEIARRQMKRLGHNRGKEADEPTSDDRRRL